MELAAPLCFEIIIRNIICHGCFIADAVRLSGVHSMAKVPQEEKDMASFSFQPTGVCSQEILFEVDEQGCVHNVQFIGGCPGNLAAIGKLVEGANARQVAGLLKGNTCGDKRTSCADQLACALEQALAK